MAIDELKAEQEDWTALRVGAAQLWMVLASCIGLILGSAASTGSAMVRSPSHSLPLALTDPHPSLDL